jgi:prepilin-type N-terminal cleavage/methylation domain-containing protein
MKNQRRRRRSGQAGVTLIEMLVVVVIIGLFVALVAPNMFRSADKARVTAARSQIEQLMTALGTYKLDTGIFPTTEQGLQALRVKPAMPCSGMARTPRRKSPRTHGATTMCTGSPANTAMARTSLPRGGRPTRR